MRLFFLGIHRLLTDWNPAAPPVSAAWHIACMDFRQRRPRKRFSSVGVPT